MEIRKNFSGRIIGQYNLHETNLFLSIVKESVA